MDELKELIGGTAIFRSIKIAVSPENFNLRLQYRRSILSRVTFLHDDTFTRSGCDLFGESTDLRFQFTA